MYAFDCTPPRSIAWTCGLSGASPASRSGRRGYSVPTEPESWTRWAIRYKASVPVSRCFSTRASVAESVNTVWPESSRSACGSAWRRPSGKFAEYCVPEPNALSRDTVGQGAAYPLVTLTAWRMVVTQARVREGERVLVWGIGGGVALAALQICKLLGAHVTVTSSSDAKLARARELGADETLRHDLLEVGKEVRARTGKRGVDAVVDCVGEKSWAQSSRVSKAGRLVTCGGTSGPR